MLIWEYRMSKLVSFILQVSNVVLSGQAKEEQLKRLWQQVEGKLDPFQDGLQVKKWRSMTLLVTDGRQVGLC